ncbi:acyl-CoA thioesterase [Halobacteriales archaeon QS_5_70_15]|nr:MAG: acyl-CoA thioesterase [Halobacteriales archaeon QS_5_70_15]
MVSYTAELEVRFRDLDPMQHVNNAIYATYLEQARARFSEDVLGTALADLDTVLAQVEVSFERPIEGVGTVRVELEVGDLGRSSIPVEYELFSEGERVATARTVQVYFDRETGESKPIPEDLREQLT